MPETDHGVGMAVAFQQTGRTNGGHELQGARRKMAFAMGPAAWRGERFQAPQWNASGEPALAICRCGGPLQQGLKGMEEIFCLLRLDQ
jgi:hypothetical protein